MLPRSPPKSFNSTQQIVHLRLPSGEYVASFKGAAVVRSLSRAEYRERIAPIDQNCKAKVGSGLPRSQRKWVSVGVDKRQAVLGQENTNRRQRAGERLRGELTHEGLTITMVHPDLALRIVV